MTMLEELEFENFKAFLRSQRVPLRPITLIYGMNSSGKSSILQLLRLLNAAVSNNSTRLPFEDQRFSFVSHQNVTHRRNKEPIRVSVSSRSDECAIKIGADYGDEMHALEYNSEALLPTTGARLLRAPIETFVDLFEEDSSSETYTALFDKDSSLDLNSERVMFMSSEDTIQGLRETYNWSLIEPGVTPFDHWMRMVLRDSGDRLLQTFHDQSTIGDIARICEELLEDELNPTLQSNTSTGTLGLLGLLQDWKIQMAYQVTSHGSVHEVGLAVPPEILSPKFFLPFKVSRAITEHRRIHAFDRPSIVQRAVRKKIVDQVTAILLRYVKRLHINGTESSSKSVSAFKQIRKDLVSIRYLGPARRVPGRYEFESTVSDSISSNHASFGSASILPDGRSALKSINDGFKALEIQYTAEVVPVVAGAVHWLKDLHYLILRDRAGTEVSLGDVGFGVGQVLPILIEMHLGGCLLVEQPELHLHPRLQSELMEQIAKAVMRTGGQVILETHSEHMVLRLQRMIRRKELSANDVSVLVVTSSPTNFEEDPFKESAPKSSNVRRIEFDESGFLLDPWPPGFFDSALDDILAED